MVCQVESALTDENAPGHFERIKVFAPDLVVLDFVPRRSENWRLLDQLRADEATSSIPVLAISTAEPVVEQSIASFNVRKTLVKPFDLDGLRSAVEEILSQPKVRVQVVAERPGAEELREAADSLVAEVRDIVSRWLERLRGIEPFKNQKHLRPSEIINGLPFLLWGTAVALRTEAPEKLFEEENVFHHAAITHALLRRQQGVGLGALVVEYEILRDVVWQVLSEKARTGWTVADVFRMGRMVNRTLDQVIAIAVTTYGESLSKTAAHVAPP